MKIVSVVIPVFNEEQSVQPLHAEILSVFKELGRPVEILFVDDGSTDGTAMALRQIKPAKVIRFRKNFGQTAAFDAGIAAASGDTIVTMDGDGQNNPADIPRLLEKLEEGFDMVVGWRKDRKDPLGKRFISRGAHLLRRIFVKDGIHDSGSSLKAAKREVFASIELYGETHRFIPGMLAAQGFRIGEIEERHRPRLHGKTKYTFSRTLRGLIDMMSLAFWRSYSSRPLHLFGGIGLVLGALGGGLLATLFVLRLFHVVSLSQSIWPLAGFFLALAGAQLFATGLLADVAAKGYYRARGTKPYSIKEVIDQK